MKRKLLLSVLGIFLTPNIFLYAVTTADRIAQICSFDKTSKQKYANCADYVGSYSKLHDLELQVIRNQYFRAERTKSCMELWRMCGEAFTKDKTNCTNDGFVMVGNQTGLMWLGNANDFHGGKRQNWHDAMKNVKGFNYCGYSDWRLPSKDELKTLTYYVYEPAKWLNSNNGFANIAARRYWSSSTYARMTRNAWNVNMYTGVVGNGNKFIGYQVLPVRGPIGD
jgi:hypothetical protein